MAKIHTSTKITLRVGVGKTTFQTTGEGDYLCFQMGVADKQVFGNATFEGQKRNEERLA